MELNVTITQSLPIISGVSKAGKEWKKKPYVATTGGEHPKDIYFELFGDKADKFPLQIGQQCTIQFDINSREFNGRWFTEISVWNVRYNVAATPAYQVSNTALANNDMPF